MTSTARTETEHAERSRPFFWLVRAGFFARGITYGVIGGLALALACGAGTAGTAANQQGALELIDQSWIGRAALLVIAAGLLAYALWKFAQGIHGHGPEGGGGSQLMDRVGNLAGGAAYVVFFAVAIRVLTGSGGSGGTPERAAAGVLGWPGGQYFVGAGGVVMIAISLYQLYDGTSGGFARESKTERMGQRERHIFLTLGRIGLSARALVFALVGYFILRAAIEFKASKAVGLDGVLARVHNEPAGPLLLALVAAGLLVFAAFSFFEGSYRRL